MTDDEALAIARKGGGWVDWHHDLNRPDWITIEGYEPTIRLDGEFTAKELLAILHFAPKEG